LSGQLWSLCAWTRITGRGRGWDRPRVAGVRCLAGFDKVLGYLSEFVGGLSFRSVRGLYEMGWMRR
jgi:hypothetical protein